MPADLRGLYWNLHSFPTFISSNNQPSPQPSPMGEGALRHPELVLQNESKKLLSS